jgi:hypothetical protein
MIKDDYLERNGRYVKGKKYVLLSESGNMPVWAKTPREYWKAVDQYERANGRLFLQVEFALPVELSKEQQIKLSREFSKKLTSLGNLPYTMAIHSENPNNPHCHVMISERQNDGIGRSPDTWFRKADAKANPGARKTDEFQKLSSYWNIRTMWTELANNALERAGLEERLDPRTLEAQGIEREAQIHEGHSDERKALNGEIKRRNARRAELEDALASINMERQELDSFELEISKGMEDGSAVHGLSEEYAELEACHYTLEKRKEHAAFTEPYAAKGDQSQSDKPRIIYTGLKEYRDGLATKPDTETQKIALRKELPNPLFFGSTDQEYEGWKEQFDAMQRKVADLCEKIGGDMGLKDTGYGKEEANRRLSDEYALEEAKKSYGRSDEWKAALKNINGRVLQHNPETEKAPGWADRKISERDAKEKLDGRIAELDGKLNNPPYGIGSAGYPEREAAADARELLKLESIRLYGESGGQISQQGALKEAIDRHPIVSDVVRRLERGRDLGR